MKVGIILAILSFPFRYPTDLEQKNMKDVSTIQNTSSDFETKEMIKTNSFKGLYSNFIIATMIGLMIVCMTTSVGIEIIGLGSDEIIKLLAIFAIFNGLGRPIFGWLAIAPTSTSTLRLYGMKNYSQNYGLVFAAYGIGAIAGVSTSGLLLDLHGNYYLVFYYVIALSILGIIITKKFINPKTKI